MTFSDEAVFESSFSLADMFVRQLGHIRGDVDCWAIPGADHPLEHDANWKVNCQFQYRMWDVGEGHVVLAKQSDRPPVPANPMTESASGCSGITSSEGPGRTEHSTRLQLKSWQGHTETRAAGTARFPQNRPGRRPSLSMFFRGKE